jgi:hypothetical protein
MSSSTEPRRYNVFDNRSNLRRHKLIHTCKKPLKCEHCDKNFRQSGNLKTHIKAHHPTIIYVPKGRKHQSKKVVKIPHIKSDILTNDRAITERSISKKNSSSSNIAISFWKTESKCDDNMLPLFGKKICAKCCNDFMPHTPTGKYDIFASICGDCTFVEQCYAELLPDLDNMFKNS